MASKKPSSTVSFNSDKYILSLLPSLVRDGLIDVYFSVRHYAEEDTKKDHWHILLVPSRPLDFNKVRCRFFEAVIGQSDLGCLPFRPSKIHDWLLYSLHDSDYLCKHGLVRLNCYSVKDVVTNEPDYLTELYREARETLLDNRLTLFVRQIRQGLSFGDILRSGFIPPNQIGFYREVYRTSTHLFGVDVNNGLALPMPDF